ncbi:MAG: FKBP-type peptidyl-prolyl cis-trans isomerase [Chitinophagaceae bacterium]|nr:FKBP-type peptidyl-prolyl cis-trans isomerase [Chitinophagaceae bacterium]
MNKVLLVLILGALSVTGFAQGSKSPAGAKKPAAKPAGSTTLFKNNTDSVSYAVGIRIMQSLKQQGFDNVNMSLLTKALADASQNKPLLNDAAIYQCMSTFQQKVTAVKQAEAQKENAAKAEVGHREGQAFLANNAKRAGVTTLPSGLQYEVLKTGTGPKPTVTSKVKCHYTGFLIDGTKFESSVDRGEPITFPLSNVIQGWQEALQLMNVGSKWKLFIPSNLAYGDNPPPGMITPGATLVFEVELLGIEN